MNNHPFHLVDVSPWPITGAVGLMTMLFGTVLWMSQSYMLLMTMGTLIIILTMIQWWRDVTREASFQGKHTSKVIISMKMGMIMFILSEVMFFSSFFWSFFHSSLSPVMEIGMVWPPLGIETFNPINIPMLNTMILLGSGVTITWAHNALINKNYNKMNQAMIITVLLGLYFSIMQMYEYLESPFCISDSIYGSTFFMATGFHGLHVIIGTIFILTSAVRNIKLHFSEYHHVGFEASAWYWHFVDVVWLFLFMSIYWWGG
uniref:Cytochrome c oxidase subunit 3 n=1 Tax=Hiratettix distanti TaxID=2893146 RepID=A0A9E6XQG5_9HEMI|nr:cytochrome c oxidase subunit III [Hiratettix distanti]UGN61528.1 cytochrome c oxidase subunit III [Hiratettix distanti]